jgi:hypothetical protein
MIVDYFIPCDLFLSALEEFYQAWSQPSPKAYLSFALFQMLHGLYS